MRFAVTILAILLGLAVVIGTLKQSKTTTSQQTTPVTTTEATDSADRAQDTAPASIESAEDASLEAITIAADTVTDAPSDSGTQTTAGEVPYTKIPGLHAVLTDQARPAVIGSDDPASPFKLRVVLSRWGAAVWKITLSDYLIQVDKPEHYLIHDRLTLPDPADRSKQTPKAYAYAAKSVTVNGVRIPLESNDAWLAGEVVTTDKVSWVEYTATLADENKTPVLRLVRRYTLKADSYDLTLEQELVNLTDTPLTVRFDQNLQGDLSYKPSYMGDKRQVVAGHFALWWDPTRESIHTKNAEVLRRNSVGAKQAQVWPVQGLNTQAELVWLASLNRYFAVVTHPLMDTAFQKAADVPPLKTVFPRIGQKVYVDSGVAEPKDDQKVMILTAGSGDLTVLPGEDNPARLDIGIFAGPREPELFNQPPYSVLHLDQTIIYSLGGACSFCTFQWLAHGLLWLLKLFEGQILTLGGVGIGTHDWGVSIIILVLLVRLILHPLTKKSQVSMMKMGKMMQAIQPEVEKVKKKYKDDQQKLNAEMMKLYKEKGVNPANMLGCAPMLLQTPIWIALYAMLYFAIELRHEPAFWGLFQWVSGGSWGFLADLSSPDNFIQLFDKPVKINLLFVHPHFQSINILPLLMAIVFYFQQKLTTPPPANEQAAQQQKMMKFVIFLFPIFLYPAPSGLTLYILASTSAGIVDSYFVRKHIKEQEASGELFKPKERKPGGFVDRISKAVEAKQQQLTKQKPQGGRDKHGRGPGKSRKRR